MQHQFTVDVEEYFRVSALEKVVAREAWDEYPSLVESSTHRLMELLAEHGARGTMFVLGWIAERHPQLVRDPGAAGHELASHGWGHRRVTTETPEAFRKSVRRSKAVLQELTGRLVWGYRAPSFSIVPRGGVGAGRPAGGGVPVRLQPFPGAAEGVRLPGRRPGLPLGRATALAGVGDAAQHRGRRPVLAGAAGVPGLAALAPADGADPGATCRREAAVVVMGMATPQSDTLAGNTPASDEPRPTLSFVIPASNEERNISATLGGIAAMVPRGVTYDVTVVDNGSLDRTAEIATERGATVLTIPKGTIGHLRNEGVRHSQGGVLVFLDADIVLTGEWGRRLPSVLDQLKREDRVITGGVCTVPRNASWLERRWFAPRPGHSFSHVGSGHMITTRRFFEELGGFDETLETGEDYDISQRALAAGGRVFLDPELTAEHLGYPQTLAEFVKREAWHGRSDFTSVRAVMRSKVAIMTVLFAVAHVLVLTGALVYPAAAAAGLLLVVAVCAASAVWKCRTQGMATVGVTAVLFYFYYGGRTLALLQVRLPRQPARHAAP
jgi:GT2 family glycosyltransferase